MTQLEFPFMKENGLGRWPNLLAIIWVTIAVILAFSISCQASSPIMDIVSPQGEVEQTTQQGLANVETDDITGVSFVKEVDMSWGLCVLLLFQSFLSHRREMTRIKQNGVKA